MSESRIEHYSRRIFDLAMVNPKVNPLDERQLSNFASQKAEELYLPEERVVEEVTAMQPRTPDFQKASKIGVQTKGLI